MSRLVLIRVLLWTACGALAVCVGTLTAQPAAQDSDKLLAEVKAAWEKREKAARNMMLKWRQEELTPKGAISRLQPPSEAGKELLPPQDVKHAGRGQLYFAGENCRVSFKRQIWDHSSKAFQRNIEDAALKDGVCKRRTLTGDREVPLGTVSRQTWNSVCDVTTWPIFASFRGLTATGQKANVGQFTSARSISSNGRPVVELLTERTETTGHSRLLVDPQHDYLAVRYELFDRAGQLLRLITIDGRHDARFGWVPLSWQVSIFRRTDLVRKANTTVEEIDVGGAVPDSTFEINYPPGTYVFDSTSGKQRSFIIREGKEPREVLPGERSAPFEDLVATEAGDLVRGKQQTGWAWYWYTSAACALILLILSVVVVRRRTRNQT